MNWRNSWSKWSSKVTARCWMTLLVTKVIWRSGLDILRVLTTSKRRKFARLKDKEEKQTTSDHSHILAVCDCDVIVKLGMRSESWKTQLAEGRAVFVKLGTRSESCKTQLTEGHAVIVKLGMRSESWKTQLTEGRAVFVKLGTRSESWKTQLTEGRALIVKLGMRSDSWKTQLTEGRTGAVLLSIVPTHCENLTQNLAHLNITTLWQKDNAIFVPANELMFLFLSVWCGTITQKVMDKFHWIFGGVGYVTRKIPFDLVLKKKRFYFLR